MDAGRLLGHEQRRPDLAVGGALGDQRQHLTLAGGEPERILVAVGRRRAVAVAVRPSPGPSARSIRARSASAVELLARATANRACGRRSSAARAGSAGGGAVAAPRSVPRPGLPAWPPRSDRGDRSPPIPSAAFDPQLRRRCGRGRGPARRCPPPGRRARPARRPGGAAAGAASWMPRPRDRVALLRPLAQVAGRWAMSASTRTPTGAHARDPHHVVGAHLEAVERLGDRRPRPEQVPPAPAQLAQQRSEHADPLRLGRLRDERLGVVQALGRQLVVALAEREIGLADLAEDQQRARQLRARRAPGAPRPAAQSPASNASSEIVSVIQSWLRVIRRGVARSPSWAISSASRVRPAQVEHVGEVRVRVAEAVEVVVVARDLDRAPQPRDPLLHAPSAISAIPSVLSTSLSARRSPGRDRRRERLLAVLRSHRGSARAGTGCAPATPAAAPGRGSSSPAGSSASARCGGLDASSSPRLSAHWIRDSRASRSERRRGRLVLGQLAQRRSAAAPRRAPGRRRSRAPDGGHRQQFDVVERRPAPGVGDARPQLERALGQVWRPRRRRGRHARRARPARSRAARRAGRPPAA